MLLLHHPINTSTFQYKIQSGWRWGITSTTPITQKRPHNTSKINKFFIFPIWFLPLGCPMCGRLDSLSITKVDVCACVYARVASMDTQTAFQKQKQKNSENVTPTGEKGIQIFH